MTDLTTETITVVTPMSMCSCRYYFYNEGASVSAVLKDANLVDIDDVKSMVLKSQGDVLSGLTGNFTWR